MTNEDRSPKDIERDIERERAGLTNTLDELQDKFSVETVVRQVSDQFRENGGDIARSVSRSVKENPVALALTGVGLAWMIFGSGTRGSDRRDRDDYADRMPTGRRTYRDNDDDYDAVRGGHGHVQTRSSFAGQGDVRPKHLSDPYDDGSYASDTLPSWARPSENDQGDGVGDSLRGAAGTVKETAASAASTARDTAGEVASSVRDTATSAGEALSDGVQTAGTATRDAGDAVRSNVNRAATTAANRATIMRARLAEGTENLTEEARNRVIAARHKAMDARDAALAQARRGGERASDLFEEQPLVAGALALTVGAAIGAALPRTRAEDDYLGAQSDRLMQDAERIFAEETEKLGNVANAASAEAKKIAQEVKSDVQDAAGEGQTVAGAVAEKAKASAKRVADTAKSEADKQDVAKRNS